MIETERLKLRHFHASDLDAFAETMADPNVVRHIGGEPNDREDAWRKMLTGAGFWSLIGIGMWAVERRSDRRLIGHVGLFEFQRDMRPSIAGNWNREPERENENANWGSAGLDCVGVRGRVVRSVCDE